jgi:hypothetical protein
LPAIHARQPSPTGRGKPLKGMSELSFSLIRQIDRRTAWTRLFPLAYLALVSAVLFLAFSHWAYDDPFITYRYALNLKNGLGFVYNPGEKVLSTTTPLFTLLLAALSFLWDDLPRIANLIGAFSLALGGLFLWDLAHTWDQPLAGWAALLLYPSFPLLVTTLGSETPLYLAFCLGCFAFYARNNYVGCAAFGALALLARPDGALVPTVLAVHYLVSEFIPNRTIPWKAILVFLALALPWFLFAWAYFGSPVPATLAVKQSQGAMAVSQRFAPGFLSLASAYAQRWYIRVEAFLALVGLGTIIWRRRRWALILAWTLLYFLGYALLGVSRYYWYFAPLVPGLIVLVGLGVSGLYDLSRSRIAALRSPHASGFITVVILILIGAPAFGQFYSLNAIRQQPDDRIHIYRAIGDWLRNNTPEQASVGTLEVGMIGYYAQRSIVDFAGLLQPDVAARLAGSTYADSADWAVEHYRPTYLALQTGVFPNLEQGYAAQHCQIAQRFLGMDYGYHTDVDVYACR